MAAAQAIALELEESVSCTECGEAPGQIRRLRKLFCSRCFVHHCDFRFRKRLYELGKPERGPSSTATSLSSSVQSVNLAAPDEAGATPGPSALLGRQQIPYFVENVLIDYDGASEHSIALLYLIRDAIVASLEASSVENPRTLPFPFTFTILFISTGVHENGEINPNRKESVRVKNFEKLKEWYKETRNQPSLTAYFPSLIVSSLEESLSITHDAESEFKILDITNQVDVQPSFPLNVHLHDRLVSLVEDLRTKTARVDLLQILGYNLSKAIATRLRLAKVLDMEDQTDLAVKMFSLMSLGRGAQLADQMNFVTRTENVMVARPLMDLTTDDLNDYLICRNLVEKCKETADARNIDNIEAQCEDFIQTLQKNFPATVPTLTRIGAKLEPTCRHSASTGNVCSLCQHPKDEDMGGATLNFGASLCYACNRILKEMKNPKLLLEVICPLR